MSSSSYCRVHPHLIIKILDSKPFSKMGQHNKIKAWVPDCKGKALQEEQGSNRSHWRLRSIIKPRSVLIPIKEEARIVRIEVMSKTMTISWRTLSCLRQFWGRMHIRRSYKERHPIEIMMISRSSLEVLHPPRRRLSRPKTWSVMLCSQRLLKWEDEAQMDLIRSQ